MKKILFALTTLTLTATAHAQYTTPNTFTSGTPIKAADMNSNFTAVQDELRRLDGRVVAFTHTSAAANITSNWTCIDNAATNGQPNAFVQFNRVWIGSTYITSPMSLFYTDGKWCIYREDTNAMPVGIKFNVLVIK